MGAGLGQGRFRGCQRKRRAECPAELGPWLVTSAPGPGLPLGPRGGAPGGDAEMYQGSGAAASTRAGRGGRWAPGGAPSRHRPPPHGPWARTPPGCRRPAPPEPPPRRRRRPARGTLGNAGRGGAGTRGSGNSGRGGGDRPAGRPASAVASREAHVGSGQAPQFCGAPQRVRPELGGDHRRPVGCGTRLRGRACACRAQGGAPRGTGPRLTPVPTQAPGQ